MYRVRASGLAPLVGATLLAASLLVSWLASAGAQQGRRVELELTESRNSGVSGTAVLRDVEGGVEVTLDMRGLPEAGVEHINHIHGGGTCADDRAGNPAPVTIPLNTITAEEDGTGSATTTLEGVNLEELQDPSKQQRYIAFHAEEEEGGGVPPVISCADLTTMSGEQTMAMESTRPLLPKSGGATAIGSSSVLLPAVALLLGLGVLMWAILERRR